MGLCVVDDNMERLYSVTNGIYVVDEEKEPFYLVTSRIQSKFDQKITISDQINSENAITTHLYVTKYAECYRLLKISM